MTTYMQRFVLLKTICGSLKLRTTHRGCSGSMLPGLVSQSPTVSRIKRQPWCLCIMCVGVLLAVCFVVLHLAAELSALVC